MKTKFESLETFNAYNQLDEDYKNLTIHFEEYKLHKKGTIESNKQMYNCLKYLNSILDQKK